MLEVLEERNHGNMVEKKHGVLRKHMTKLVKLKLTSSSQWLIVAEQDRNPGHWKICCFSSWKTVCLLEKTAQEPTGPQILC